MNGRKKLGAIAGTVALVGAVLGMSTVYRTLPVGSSVATTKSGSTTTASTTVALDPPQPVGDPGPWNLVFDSEFNGSSLDTSQWSTGMRGVSGITEGANSYEQECYDPAQVSVAGGALNLSVIPKEETCGGFTRPYASG